MAYFGNMDFKASRQREDRQSDKSIRVKHHGMAMLHILSNHFERSWAQCLSSLSRCFLNHYTQFSAIKHTLPQNCSSQLRLSFGWTDPNSKIELTTTRRIAAFSGRNWWTCWRKKCEINEWLGQDFRHEFEQTWLSVAVRTQIAVLMTESYASKKELRWMKFPLELKLPRFQSVQESFRSPSQKHDMRYFQQFFCVSREANPI